MVMDIEAFARREKMLKLREELISVEEARLNGNRGYTLDEVDNKLNELLDGMANDGRKAI